MFKVFTKSLVLINKSVNYGWFTKNRILQEGIQHFFLISTKAILDSSIKKCKPVIKSNGCLIIYQRLMVSASGFTERFIHRLV